MTVQAEKRKSAFCRLSSRGSRSSSEGYPMEKNDFTNVIYGA